MSIKTKETELHTKLHALYVKNDHSDGNTYISDGIINYSQWETNKAKLLFVLKEPNTAGRDGLWSLNRVFEDIAYEKQDHDSPTIRQIVKISRIVNKLLEDNDSTDFDDTTIENIYLNKIALINIKKNYGYSNADWTEIENFAQLYKKELKEQIDLIKPKVIYCGGYRENPRISIYELVKNILQIEEPYETIKYGMALTVNIFKEVILLDAYHPQYSKISADIRIACMDFTKNVLNQWLNKH